MKANGAVSSAQLMQVLNMLAGSGVLTPQKAGKLTRSKRKSAKQSRAPLSDEERATFRAANDAECIKVFTAAGFADVKPRENVLPANSKRGGDCWIKRGFIPKKGTKAVKVNGIPLFHQDQVVPLAASGETVH